MLDVLVSGLVTGYAIAVPVGAVAALIVALSARTSWRIGAAAETLKPVESRLVVR